MAFTTIFTDSKTGDFANAYNVDYPVGAGWVGRRDDVMLVQMLFRILYTELGGDDGTWKPPAGETEPIKVDGICGQQTRRYIMNFQQVERQRGYQIVVDGRFDPFREQGGRTRIQHAQYSLERLNGFCYRLCRSKGMDNFEGLPWRDDIPPELQAALQQYRFTPAAYA